MHTSMKSAILQNPAARDIVHLLTEEPEIVEKEID